MAAEDVRMNYFEAVSLYPLTASDTCASLENKIQSIEQEISSLYEQKATYRASDKKVYWIDDKIGGYLQRKNDLVAKFNQFDCQEAAAQKSIQDTIDYNTSLMEKASGLAAKTSSTAKYVLIGSVILIAVVVAIVVVKKNKE